jgi:hypothetical protein
LLLIGLIKHKRLASAASFRSGPASGTAEIAQRMPKPSVVTKKRAGFARVLELASDLGRQPAVRLDD